MEYTEEGFNLITTGDRLMQSGLSSTDFVQKLILFVEARRCYRNAGLDSMVKILDRWLSGDQIRNGSA